MLKYCRIIPMFQRCLLCILWQGKYWTMAAVGESFPKGQFLSWIIPLLLNAQFPGSAVQFPGVSEGRMWPLLYFILDCMDTLNIPRYLNYKQKYTPSSSSHFRLIRLKGIKFFHCFFHSVWFFPQSIQVGVTLWFSSIVQCLSGFTFPVFVAVTPPDSLWFLAFAVLGNSEGYRNVCPGRERIRFSVSWLNGLLQWSCCMKKASSISTYF